MRALDARTVATEARRAGRTLREAADLAGVSHVTVMRWEREERGRQRRGRTLGALAEFDTAPPEPAGEAGSPRQPAALPRESRARPAPLAVLPGGGEKGRASDDVVRAAVEAGVVAGWDGRTRLSIARRTGRSEDEVEAVYIEVLRGFARGRAALAPEERRAEALIRGRGLGRSALAAGDHGAAVRALSQELRVEGLVEQTVHVVPEQPVLSPEELAAKRAETWRRLAEHGDRLREDG